MSVPANNSSEAALQRERSLAMILLFIVPALFTTNVIVARAVNDTVPPFALAYWRWMLAFLIFLPVVGPDLWRHRAAIAAEWRDLLVLGILGMGICGAFVYIGADTTSATNIGLIFGTAPIIIGVTSRPRASRTRGTTARRAARSCPVPIAESHSPSCAERSPYAASKSDSRSASNPKCLASSSATRTQSS